MRPYCQYIKELSFTQITQDKLVEHIIANKDNFAYTGTLPDKYGKTDWNWYCPKEFQPTELMDEVGKRFKVPVHYEILGQTPWTVGKIHKDQYNPFVPRISVISLPIYPIDRSKIGPTKFWTLESGSYDDYDNAVFNNVYTATYETETAIIFNLQEYHSAMNETDDYRFHCQFSTDIPFDEIVKLYDSNQLFD